MTTDGVGRDFRIPPSFGQRPPPGANGYSTKGAGKPTATSKKISSASRQRNEAGTVSVSGFTWIALPNSTPRPDCRRAARMRNKKSVTVAGMRCPLRAGGGQLARRERAGNPAVICLMSCSAARSGPAGAAARAIPLYPVPQICGSAQPAAPTDAPGVRGRVCPSTEA